jgi:hypothetical protein
LDWNFLFGEALDFHHETFFVQANQTDRFTASAGATGTAVKSAYALSGNDATAKVVVTAATSTNAVSGSPLYIRCTTAQGAAATADVFIYGYDLSFLS